MTFQRKIKQIMLFLILFVSSYISPTYATDKIEKVVVDLKEQWLYYDASYNSYIAYIPAYHQEQGLIHFWLKPQQFKQYKLLLELKEDTYLYINHKLQKKYKKGWQIISLDSLSKQTKQENIFLSFYGSVEKTIIGVPSFQKQKVVKNEEVIHKNSIGKFKQQITLYIIIILVAYTLTRQYDVKMLREYLQVQKFFQVQRRIDNPLFIRVFQNNNLLFLFSYCLLTGTFFYLLETISGKKSTLFFFINTNETLQLSWFNWAIWVGALVIWTLFKYIILWLAANLLSVSKLINLHFYEYIRVSHFFYLPLTAILLILSLRVPYAIYDWYGVFKSTLIVAYTLRTIILWYNANSFGEFRKLDFFSYLCVSEIIPLMIYIKILFFM